MKPVISLFSMALSTSLALSSLCLAQNITIHLEPVNPPIQIPAPGGSFDYDVTMVNTGTFSQTFDTWSMMQLPDSSLYGPMFGPVTLTIPAGALITPRRQQRVSANVPVGVYIYEGRVGIYPNIIWNSDTFTFTKTREGSELWEARFNGTDNDVDRAHALAADEDGNVYVTGVSVNSGTYGDYTTIKYSSVGVQQWIARYDGPGNAYDEAFCLAVDEEGNVYVTGESIGIGTSGDYATIKYNSAGVQQWVARYNGPGYGGDEPHSLTLDEVGNIYVTGSSWGSGTFRDYATIKYNATGQQQWVVRYNGPGNYYDEAYSLTIDSAGNVYVTGYDVTSGTNSEYATIKYNSTGLQQWVARYVGPGNYADVASSIAVDGAGNVYVTGESYGNGTGYDYATIKYDASGVQIWVSRYNGTGNDYDYASSLAVDTFGNVYVTGRSYGSGTQYDYATIKYDASGVQQWAARYNGSGNYWDRAYALTMNGAGNVYVTGGSWGNGTNPDYATIKYDSAGFQQWVARYNGSRNGNDWAYSLAVDGAGNVYVTGESYSSLTDYDYCTIKYSGGTIANWQPVEALVFGAQEPVTEYQLQPCYPNPFNATTVARFQIPDARHVSLQVYDSAGRLVITLVDGWREAGTHELTFDAEDLPSGVYFSRMQAGEYSAVQKMMLVK